MDFKMEDYRGDLMFGGAMTLTELGRQAGFDGYNHFTINDDHTALRLALLGTISLGAALKLGYDASKGKGLGVPARLFLAGGSAVFGVGCVGYSLSNLLF